MSNYRRYFDNNNPIFITFVTQNRKEILIDNIDILRNSFRYSKEKFNYEIIASVILKEHCHLTLSAKNQVDIPKLYRFKI